MNTTPTEDWVDPRYAHLVAPRYLGDGVYARFDGYYLTLSLDGQEPTMPITQIMLEPPIVHNLFLYMLSIRQYATNKERHSFYSFLNPSKEDNT